MPVISVAVRDSAFHMRLLQQYLLLLKKYPILTKSVTSSVLSALGNLLSQVLENRRKFKNGRPEKDIDVPGIARFAIYGLCITGPISHYFYHLLELLVPSTVPYCMPKRLLLDRLVFAPAFLLLFFIVMNILERKRWPALQDKLRASYWPALKMNWKVWTPFQFVNINFVPIQFRVLFANLVALFWYAYLASVRK
ncbi:peroxisomal membrane protein 2 [Paramormyrops kingsleyae]|uniref:peroxisomal membrane protein 2 n=1 Tax=Paramormyrops kingsleyae TaxID=1676925 RepID=UPI000CD5FAF3|nr:peroxisomal membrane protein 2 [Paramormyrops kingsleyae]